ncbi:hypothetical protein E8E12_008536 [Didymella heteroderae]|uniref:Uncharacterized protein n=1 Tax=Didymella heteroderae TaxID=1769908 RepID=A0A9P4X059_9PLEO|nr:hypothetical protein E8E12_008536 [Didymella heteroderae]
MASVTMITAVEIKSSSAFVAWQLQSYSESARSPMMGTWNQLMFSWSNWSRAKCFDVDFSSAVVKTGLPDSDRTTKVGEDTNGDWWANWTMRAEAWSLAEEALSKA